MEQGCHFTRFTAVLQQAILVAGDADPLVEEVHHPLAHVSLGVFAEGLGRCGAPGSITQPLGHLGLDGIDRLGVAGIFGPGERRAEVTGERHGDGWQPPLQGSGRPGCDAGGLHIAVEDRVPEAETLVVGTVARSVGVEQHHHQARALVVAADAAAGLDVFSRGLWLAQHHHQAEAADVETHGDHVGGQSRIDPLLLVVEAELEAGLGGAHF